MSDNAKITTNHDEIKKWIEERNGKPSVVSATKGDGGGILRIDFPGYSGEDSLEEIDWNRFFEIFDDKNLAFLYQENLKSGEESRFVKFIDRNSEQAKNA